MLHINHFQKHCFRAASINSKRHSCRDNRIHSVIFSNQPNCQTKRNICNSHSKPSDDTTVSKTHALLEPTAEGISVTDLGSTNGTYLVDSQGSHELAPGLAETVPRGGAIYFGEAECRVR